MWSKKLILTTAFLLAGTSVLADDLSGKDQFMCSGVCPEGKQCMVKF